MAALENVLTGVLSFPLARPLSRKENRSISSAAF
jgi:hypothetical protein